MGYPDFFDRAAAHLRGKRINVLYKRGYPIPESRMKELVKASAIIIPPSLCAFYAELGNGVHFGWDRPVDSIYAYLEIPPLEEVAIPSLQDVNWRREWDDSFDFHGCKDRNLARKTALRMQGWVGIDTDGSGSRICIDGNLEPAPVVFDQHAWFDGGSGFNGRLMGPNLRDFLDNWSRVCFQFPRTPWWPAVLTDNGVDWASDEFDAAFRL